VYGGTNKIKEYNNVVQHTMCFVLMDLFIIGGVFSMRFISYRINFIYIASKYM
jgi:hypothetical protein